MLRHLTIDNNNPTKIEPVFDLAAETLVRVPGQTYIVNVQVGGTLNPMPTMTPGFLRRDAAAQRYGERSGLDLAVLPYYLVFGTFKMAVVLQQIYFRFHKGQTQDERFAGMGEGAKALFRLAASRRP